MDPRIDYPKASPAAVKAMYALQAAVNASGLESSLQELVKLRVSQINGCAFCIDLHSREATAKGEKPERLFLLDAWREAPVYTPRERAALGWAEALTLISLTHAPDDVYAEAREHFEEAELVNLTLGRPLKNAALYRRRPRAKLSASPPGDDRCVAAPMTDSRRSTCSRSRTGSARPTRSGT